MLILTFIIYYEFTFQEKKHLRNIIDHKKQENINFLKQKDTSNILNICTNSMYISLTKMARPSKCIARFSDV